MKRPVLVLVIFAFLFGIVCNSIYNSLFQTYLGLDGFLLYAQKKWTDIPFETYKSSILFLVFLAIAMLDKAKKLDSKLNKI